MYTLYFSTGACSLATQVILRELSLPFTLENRAHIEDFDKINPIGAVPALHDGNKLLTEGAAIILHLLENHPNSMLPVTQAQRELVIQQLMFANATMHPAYSKLFFIASVLPEGEARTQALNAAAEQINMLWQHVESQLQNQPYMAGTHLSPADILLSVYQTWGQYFDVAITVGPNTQQMIAHVRSRPSFVAAIDAEKQAA